MKRKSTGLLAILLTIAALALAACGDDNTAQGDAIFDSRGAVAGAEGLFQRGDSAAAIEQKATQNNLQFRKLEVANFIGGTRNEITVVTEPNQPYVAYAFLPTGATTADALMVVVKRDVNTTQAIVGFTCSGIKFYLNRAQITDFTNDVCS
jgi:predicted small secreted protein